MLHYNDEAIKAKLFDGLIGLEKEGLRVTEDGFLAQSLHPFPADEKYIVRDFCENQTEINTPPVSNAREAYEELLTLTRKIKDTLAGLENKEYLWPFSNPPYILNEANIPIARFQGEDYAKTEYREYLAMRYGRYKMTFSGIHFNYSFDEDLLKADYALSGETDYKKYKDDFYVSLAASAQIYNWLVVAISAASPLLDSSYFEKGNCGKYVNFKPLPLRDFFAQDEIEGEYYGEGRYHKLIITPRKEDLEYLRSFKHEDLTFRGTIEFRSVCCQPIKDAMSVAAFHTGLKERLHELTELLENDKVIYGHGYNATELRHLFIQDTLPSFVDQDEVYKLCRKVLQLALEGLRDRGLGEEKYLEPLFARVEKQESPGAYMLRRLSEGAELKDIIREFGRL